MVARHGGFVRLAWPHLFRYTRAGHPFLDTAHRAAAVDHLAHLLQRC